MNSRWPSGSRAEPPFTRNEETDRLADVGARWLYKLSLKALQGSAELPWWTFHGLVAVGLEVEWRADEGEGAP